MHSACVPVCVDLLSLFDYLVRCSIFHSSFVRLLFSFDSFAFYYSLFCCSKEKGFNSDPGLYFRYFDPVVREVPVVPAVQEISSSSMQVNKHHTSDCSDFVLV